MMSIEIKATYGHILYAADNASDVRIALQEAVMRGANLRDADLGGANLRDADLRGAYLRGAYLGGAYLGGANLRGAYLRGAYLGGAYLSGANLRGANLRGANLRGANLRGADGLNPLATTPLHMLVDQPGKIRAYKLVTANGEGPDRGGIVYRVGEAVSVDNAVTDPDKSCAAGINVATLDWCLNGYRVGYRVLVVEFEATDIAAIPNGSDGKFRLHRCTVVAEKTLAELGLTQPAELEAEDEPANSAEP